MRRWPHNFLGKNRPGFSAVPLHCCHFRTLKQYFNASRARNQSATGVIFAPAASSVLDANFAISGSDRAHMLAGQIVVIFPTKPPLSNRHKAILESIGAATVLAVDKMHVISITHLLKRLNTAFHILSVSLLPFSFLRLRDIWGAPVLTSHTMNTPCMQASLTFIWFRLILIKSSNEIKLLSSSFGNQSGE